MKNVVIEIKIVIGRLNRLSATRDRIGKMEDKREEIIHNATQKNKKVQNTSWETWRIQRRVPARENKVNEAKAVFTEKRTEHFPESEAYILRFRKQ